MPAPSKAFTTFADSAVDPDSPIDTALMTGLRDNDIHLREWLGLGYTAAQNHDHDGTNSKPVVGVADGAITETKLGAGAVAQAKLKSTTGTVSTTSATGVNLTLPGGQYGFYPLLHGLNAADNNYWGWNASGALGREAALVVGGTSTANIFLSVDGGGSPPTVVATQRYIQASPPYDLGDGEVPLFVFVILDSLGTIVSTWVAPDPPWANNGPTVINPLGRIVKLAQTTEKFKDAAASAGRRAAYFNALRQASAMLNSSNPEVQKQVRAILQAPISQEEKQRDMPLIPHPFQGNDMTGKTVVLLDPVGTLCEELYLAREFGGDSVPEILHGGYLNIDNVPLPRVAPPGVMPVAATWKLTA